jgi:hypothetical protein
VQFLARFLRSDYRSPLMALTMNFRKRSAHGPSGRHVITSSLPYDISDDDTSVDEHELPAAAACISGKSMIESRSS